MRRRDLGATHTASKFGEGRRVHSRDPTSYPSAPMWTWKVIFGALETPNKVTSASGRRLELVLTFSKTRVRPLTAATLAIWQRMWVPSFALVHQHAKEFASWDWLEHQCVKWG